VKSGSPFDAAWLLAILAGLILDDMNTSFFLGRPEGLVNRSPGQLYRSPETPSVLFSAGYHLEIFGKRVGPTLNLKQKKNCSSRAVRYDSTVDHFRLCVSCRARLFAPEPVHGVGEKSTPSFLQSTVEPGMERLYCSSKESSTRKTQDERAAGTRPPASRESKSG
jgi:hypothetical protein